MRDRLDAVDLKILRHLQSEGRITNADLARKVGLSPPSVLQRVRKLEESGCIKGYYAQLDAETLGFSLHVIAQISLALHQEKPIESFHAAIQDIPEVLECWHVSGDYDYFAKIVARDMHHYERLVRERLSSLPGVGRIHSCFVMGAPKDTAAIPVEDPDA